MTLSKTSLFIAILTVVALTTAIYSKVSQRQQLKSQITNVSQKDFNEFSQQIARQITQLMKMAQSPTERANEPELSKTLVQLHKQIKKLNTNDKFLMDQIRGLQKERIENSRQSPSLSDQQALSSSVQIPELRIDRDDPVNLAEQKRLITQHFKALDTSVFVQDIDTSWAPQTTTGIQSAIDEINNEDFVGSTAVMSEVDCRQSICKMSVKLDDMFEAGKFDMEFARKTTAILPSASMNRVIHEDGSIEQVYYLARTGHDILAYAATNQNNEKLKP